jgi:hypothetical protein
MGRFFNLIGVLLIVAALAFLAAPWFAFRALRADSRDGDVQGVAELVDYNAVRTDLKGQLGDNPAAADAPAPSVWTDPLGAIRRAMDPLTPPPPAVEHYVSLEGLHALTRGYTPGRAPPEPPPPHAFADQVRQIFAERQPALRYWGPNRVRFGMAPPDAPARETIFTFQRRTWFGWKLVGIRLPGQPPPR